MRDRLPWPILAVFAITFLLYRNAVLNHVYDFGGGSDTLYYAGMLWRGDLLLTSPPAMDDRSYYHAHLSVLFAIPALLSHFLSFDHVQWYALVIAFFHAFATGSFAWACGRVARQKMRRAWAADAAAFVLGLAYAGCGLQAVFMGLPHIEIAIPALLISTLAALALRQRIAIWPLFAALLAAREETGFHAASFLMPLVAFVRLREGRWLKTEALLAGLGLAYSLGLLLLMPRLFEGGGYQFRTYYVGDPPFAHVTFDEIARRTNFFLWQVGRVWIPITLLTIYALWRRDPIMAVGAVAVVPWLILHVIFVRHETGQTLSYYYAFPVLCSLAWPAIVALYRIGPAPPGGVDRHWLLLQLAVVAAAYVPALNSRLPFYGSNYRDIAFTLRDASRNAEIYRAFTRALESGRPELGRVRASLAAITLAPHVLRRQEWIELPAPGETRDAENVDSILLFDGYWGCPDVNAFAAKAQLPNAFYVPGTRIVLLTRRGLIQLPTFRPLLVSHPKPNGPFCDRKTLR